MISNPYSIATAIDSTLHAESGTAPQTTVLCGVHHRIDRWLHGTRKSSTSLPVRVVLHCTDSTEKTQAALYEFTGALLHQHYVVLCIQHGRVFTKHCESTVIYYIGTAGESTLHAHSRLRCKLLDCCTERTNIQTAFVIVPVLCCSHALNGQYPKGGRRQGHKILTRREQQQQQQ